MAYNSFINKQVNANQPIFQFKKDRNNATVIIGDGLGNIKFQGFDGTTYLTTSQILSVASGTIAANRIGSSLEFYTHPDSVSVSTQRMLILPTGGIQINAADSGASLVVSNSTDVCLQTFQTLGGARNIDSVQTSDDDNPVLYKTYKRRTGGTINAADELFSISVSGQQGGSDYLSAKIRVYCQTVSPGIVSGNIDFFTTNTAGTNAQRLFIGTEGNVVINTPTSGVALTIVGGGETITAGNLLLSSGNVNIPASTSLIGQYQIASQTALHAYGTNNIFAGASCGNFTGTGTVNTAIGQGSFTGFTTGSQNTCIGSGAGQSISSGNYNVGLGYWSAINTGAGSSNICINNFGAVESNTLRIGSATGAGNQQLSAAYICGIDNVNVGSVAKVVTMASNQLGTATITAGSGISITPTANTITISTTNGIAWVEVTGITQSMAVDTGYIANNVALVTLTLPTVAVVGDRVRIAGKGTGLFRIAQNAGQVIHYGNQDSTVGVGGSVTAILRYDCIELLCTTATTDWTVLSSVGNLTVV